MGAAVGFSIGHIALWNRNPSVPRPNPYFVESRGLDARPLQPLREMPTFFPIDLDKSPSALDEPSRVKVSDALHTSDVAASTDASGSVAAADAQRATPAITNEVERLLPPQPTLPNPAPLPLKLPEASPLSEHDEEREEAIRAMVDKELGDVPAAQKDVWFDSLRDLSRDDAANVLRMWKQFGGPAQDGLLPLEPLELKSQVDELSSAAPLNDLAPQTISVDDDAEREVLTQALRIRQRNIQCSELPGFKRRIPILIESGKGTTLKRVASRTDFAPGILDQTDLPLDWAIDGDGFFEVTEGQETFYTRGGRWALDAERRLVLADSEPPLRLAGEWVIPEKAEQIVLSADGRLTVRLSGLDDAVAAPLEIGQVKLAMFLNPAGLEPRSNALFRATAASGEANSGTAGVDQRGTLRQGMLELSNVGVEAEYLAIDDLDMLLAE